MIRHRRAERTDEEWAERDARLELFANRLLEA
jgi:hypothetical protein